MVFFVCSGCGTSMKKNQVQNHTYKCRSCQYVSCIDCSKEFWGRDYESHTKCITENQKYGGANAVHRENKGEAKQELWSTLVKEKIANTPNMNRKLNELFDFILRFDNVPRKKAKFVNFLKSGNFRDPYLVEEAWSYMEGVLEELRKKTNNQSNNSSTNTEEEASVPSSDSQPAVASTEDSIKSERKSKRERKEERQQKQTKVQKKDKRKRAALEENENEAQDGLEKPKKKKKKKHSKSEEANQENEEPEVDAGENGIQDFQDAGVCGKPSPFKWKKAITTVLKDAPEEGMKMKKLKRKVFAMYMESKADAPHIKSDEEVHAMISKKLQMRNDKFVVIKEKRCYATLL